MNELLKKLGRAKACVLGDIEKAFDVEAEQARLNHEAELARIEAAKNKALGRVGVDFGGVLEEVEKDLSGSPEKGFGSAVALDVGGKETLEVPAVDDLEVNETEFLKVGH